MNRSLTILVSTTLLLAGCKMPAATTVGGDDVTLALQPRVQDGSYRSVAATVPLYSTNSINHVMLKLYDVTGGETAVVRNGSPVTADVLAGALGKQVSFSNLHRNTTYRIRAYAYKASGTAEADKISVDATSYVDVAVGNNPTPTLSPLPVYLANSLFNGQGNGSVLVYGGGFFNPAETLTVGTLTQPAAQSLDFVIQNVVGKPDPQGIAATSWVVSNSYGMAYDSQGNLYLCNNTLNQVYKMSPSGQLTLVAGDGTNVESEGTDPLSVGLGTPQSVAVASNGDVYIATNSRLRIIPASSGTYYGQSMIAGKIYTIAGGGGNAAANGLLGTSVGFSAVSNIAFDSQGNVFTALWNESRVMMLARSTGTYYGRSMTAGNLYNLCGTGTNGTSSGDGTAAGSATCNNPDGVAVDAQGNLFFSENSGGNDLRMIPAANGTYFGRSMNANCVYTLISGMDMPQTVAVDGSGNVAVFDANMSSRVRFMPRTAGTYFGQAMTVGNAYTIVGSGGSPSPASIADGAAATSVCFAGYAMAFDASGNLAINDGTNKYQRFVCNQAGTYYGKSMAAGKLYAIAGNGASRYSGNGIPAATALANGPTDVAVDADENVLISDRLNYRVRFVPHANGTYFGQSMLANYCYTIAGNGTNAAGADGGAGTSSSLSTIQGVAFDSNGNAYFAESGSHRIRVVARTPGNYWGQAMTAGNVYTVVGNGTSGLGGNTSAASVTGAVLKSPYDVAFDSSGNMYVADLLNYRVKMVPKADGKYWGTTMTTGNIYTIAGDGGTTLTSGSAATLCSFRPIRVAFDGAGNLFIMDQTNHAVGMVPRTDGAYFSVSTKTANFFYLVAGTGTAGTGTVNENVAATGECLKSPLGMGLDASGNLFIGDGGNYRIRMVARTTGTAFGGSRTMGNIYTVVGNGTNAYGGDGGPSTQATIGTVGGIEFGPSPGRVYIADTGNHRIRVIR